MALVTLSVVEGSTLGSCRDYAWLFMCTARRLGIAARFISGYLHAPATELDYGATHAWAEVYLPGGGWKGFDPTSRQIAGSHQPLTQVAEQIGLFNDSQGMRKGIFLSIDPLGSTTLQAQHQNERSWTLQMQFQITGSLNSH